MNDADTYRELCDYLRETAKLESTQAVLEWDERTGLPTKAGPYRAEQIACLAGLIHHRRTSGELGERLAQLANSDLAADPHTESGCDIFWASRDYEKHCKLPQRLVEEITKATILGQQAWAAARQQNDFSSFLPHLKTIIALKREQAEAIGYDDHPYDALLDDFEPAATTAQVRPVLTDLREQLVTFVQTLQDADRSAPREILERKYPKEAQARFAREATERIGFDYERGRLDETDHPFCTSLGPHDCRILTRYDEEFFSTCFFGALHEAGHGMYDQGLPPDRFGLPSGSYISLGIHESQSRMWENAVGRSIEFWRHFFPAAQRAFPAALSDVTVDQFHFAVNDVRPSLIRVEADEVTYNLHIVIRFELECAMITGDLIPEDAPAAWNEAYERNLGITPPDDAHGILQDIHWSAGLIGYFPTYTLGNLYAAQLFATAQSSISDLHEQLENGSFDRLLSWLRRNVHAVGRRMTAGELLENVSGQSLQAQPLLDYLHGRFDPLYGLAR